LKIYFNGYFFNYEKEKLIEASLVFSEWSKISNNFYFNIHSVSEQDSKSLNNKYFQKNKPTDVLSFPLYKDLSRILELNRDHEEDLGDMFINRKIVKKHAQIYEKSFVDELQFIIIHGLLHLVGYSHENEKELRKTEDKLMEVIWNGS
jgi:probable rRNA maturation factor